MTVNATSVISTGPIHTQLHFSVPHISTTFTQSLNNGHSLARHCRQPQLSVYHVYRHWLYTQYYTLSFPLKSLIALLLKGKHFISLSCLCMLYYPEHSEYIPYGPWCLYHSQSCVSDMQNVACILVLHRVSISCFLLKPCFLRQQSLIHVQGVLPVWLL